MGFWDKVKTFFGGSPTPPRGSFAALPSKDLENRIRAITLESLKVRAGFAASDVAEAIAPGTWTADDLKIVADVLERLWEQQYFAPFDYSKTWRSDPLPSFVYHAVEAPPPVAGVTAAPTTPTTPRGASPVQPRVAPTQQTSPTPNVSAAPYRTPQNPFAAPGILGLAADELRKRALRINPMRTAWIGRTDTIPPQTDERTALIDRGLILRGLLTEQQIAEIHQVGDQWLNTRRSGVERSACGSKHNKSPRRPPTQRWRNSDGSESLAKPS